MIDDNTAAAIHQIEAQVKLHDRMITSIIRRLADLEEHREERVDEQETNIYKMKEPNNAGAVVIDEDGSRWTREFPPSQDEPLWQEPWGSWGKGMRHWRSIPNPVPFQNVILTADDQEPPIDSVIVDARGGSLQRGQLGEWFVSGLDDSLTWAYLNFPVTLVYRGEEQQ